MNLMLYRVEGRKKKSQNTWSMIVFDKTQTNEIKKDYSCDRITVTTENEQGYTHGVRRKGRGKKKGRCFVHQVHPWPIY